MKAIVTTCSLAVALLIPSNVYADDYMAPQNPWTFVGEVALSKAISHPWCDIEITIGGPNDSPDSTPAFGHTDISNASATLAISGGGLGFCHSVIADPVPAGNITYISTGPSTGTLTFHNVYLTYPPGDCEGDIVFSWDESSQTLGLEQTLPPVSGMECAMSGVLDLVSPPLGDINDELDPDHNPSH